MKFHACLRRFLHLAAFMWMACLCSSGIAAPGIARDQPGTDRPGGDFTHHALAAADPQLCEKECAGNPKCRAFTYVKPGFQGAKAQCWLKKSVPPAVSSSCCVSGRKTSAPSPRVPQPRHKPIAAVGADGQPLPPGASGMAQCKLGGAKCPKRMRAAFDDDQGCICIE